MKTGRYLNDHVKTISHLNILRAIYEFHKTNLETNLVTHYILSQHGTKKGIKIFGDRGVRAVQKGLDKLHIRKVIQPRLPRDLNI